MATVKTIRAQWSEGLTFGDDPDRLRAHGGIEFTAELEPDENPREVILDLLDKAQAIARFKIDQFCVFHGRPPKYLLESKVESKEQAKSSHEYDEIPF